MNSTGRLWRQALHILQQSRPAQIVVDASSVSYCDGAGVAFFVKLQQYQAETRSQVTIAELKEEFCRLLDLYGQIPRETPTGKSRESLSVVEQIGHAMIGIWQDVQVLLTFVGELMATFAVLNLCLKISQPTESGRNNGISRGPSSS